MDLDTTSEFAIFGEYIYYKPILEIVCTQKSCLKSAFHTLQENLKTHKNSFAVGFVSYELGILEYGFNEDSSVLDFNALDSIATNKDSEKLPLVFFRLFSKKMKLSNARFPKSSIEFLPTIIQNIDKSRYANDFANIKNALKQGQSYQINYTQELLITSKINGLEIFNAILPRQNTKYKAYLNTPFVEIASFSPELFFKLRGRKISVKPMKGTMPRHPNKKRDKANKKALQNDTKNVAENIMIVDLLRNDLHKIAHNFSYKLLQVKSYKTLHQMTSKISATLRKNSLLETQNHAKSSNVLYEIFAGLFPCGSISGVPKKASLEIIKRLEKRERGIYCGAIGTISHKNKQINAEFSVPIRTLFRHCSEKFWRYGVGSGVVWDSNADEEIAELELKSSFLFRQDYSLIETMLMKNNHIFLLDSHINRLTKSAINLGFDLGELKRFDLLDFANKDFKLPNLIKNVQDFMEFNPLNCAIINSDAYQKLPPKMLENIKQNPANYNDNKAKILRLLLHKRGQLQIEILPLKNLTSSTIKIAKNRLDSRNDALYHKSTLRAHFKQIPQAQKREIFDFIYLNKKGEVCEGSRSNVVVLMRTKKGNKMLYTPSQKSGLLNGVLRDNFVRHKILHERVLYLEDLHNVEKIFCINSVRGVQEVFL